MRTLRIVAVALMLAACSDAVAPTPENVPGSYVATSFVAEGEDILSAGASLTLVLGADGDVAGDLFVPASVGGPLDADMAGTYEIVGTGIVIEQDADTFVRDATWSWADGVLSGSFGGPAGVSVRLER